jgi:hypothetical protein
VADLGLSQAIDLSSAIVYAQVTNVYAGPDIINGESIIPTQRIAFEVKNRLQGQIEDSFELFHTGNNEFVLEGDPRYKAGQRYVLFGRNRSPAP